MAKATLPTNYRDDILNVSTEGKRKYRMNYNDDGTVSFVDVTPYDQEGSDFGAGDINATNEAVNQSFDKSKLIRDMDAINALTQEGFAPDALALKDVNESLGGFEFYTDEQGKAYYKPMGADSGIPFKSIGNYFICACNDPTTRGFTSSWNFLSDIGSGSHSGSSMNITFKSSQTISLHVLKDITATLNGVAMVEGNTYNVSNEDTVALSAMVGKFGSAMITF